VILPDSTIILDYILAKTTDLLDKLLVYPEKMENNLMITRGLIFSQAVLLALVKKGVTREDAYLLVQGPAMECWKTGIDFTDTIRQDEAVKKHLSEEEIERCFDLKHQLRNVDAIFRRLGL
jgi:adenylosuccinate lyase